MFCHPSPHLESIIREPKAITIDTTKWSTNSKTPIISFFWQLEPHHRNWSLVLNLPRLPPARNIHPLWQSLSIACWMSLWPYSCLQACLLLHLTCAFTAVLYWLLGSFLALWWLLPLIYIHGLRVFTSNPTTVTSLCQKCWQVFFISVVPSAQWRWWLCCQWGNVPCLPCWGLLSAFTHQQ